MSPIYLLFQYTKFTALSITQSDSLLKCSASSAFFGFAPSLMTFWKQQSGTRGRGGLVMLCQLLEPELEN